MRIRAIIIISIEVVHTRANVNVRALTSHFNAWMLRPAAMTDSRLPSSYNKIQKISIALTLPEEHSMSEVSIYASNSRASLMDIVDLIANIVDLL